MKNVHFASDELLRTVRVFNASGKPINGSKQQAADDNPSSPDILKRLVSAARAKGTKVEVSVVGSLTASSLHSIPFRNPLNVMLFILYQISTIHAQYSTDSKYRKHLTSGPKLVLDVIHP